MRRPEKSDSSMKVEPAGLRRLGCGDTGSAGKIALPKSLKSKEKEKEKKNQIEITVSFGLMSLSMNHRKISIMCQRITHTGFIVSYLQLPPIQEEPERLNVNYLGILFSLLIINFRSPNNLTLI